MERTNPITKIQKDKKAVATQQRQKIKKKNNFDDFFKKEVDKLKKP